MPGSRLFWKLYLGTVFLVAVTAVIIGLLIGRGIEAEVLDATRRELDRGTVLLQELVRARPARIQDAVTRLGEETGIRFTLIDSSGAVLADSREDPARMEDHSGRPEVVAARGQGVGVATRMSASVGTRMMYVARPADDAGGIVRASLPLDDIHDRQARLRRTVVLGALLAAAAALLISVPLSRSFTAPFVKMSEAARAIAAGDYGGRIGVERPDEIGAFVHSFNVMAGTLQERIETLTEERNRVLAVLGGMVEGVVAVDGRERVIHMNGPAAEILGADPEESLGKPLGTVTRVREIPDVLSDTLRSGVPRSREIHLPDASGTRMLEVHSAPIHGAVREGVGAVIVLHDVTELRRLEGVRRDFVANVSHELKTPLTVVRATVETMLEDPGMDPDTRSRFLRKMSLQSDRLTSIVTDLLSLARIESGTGGPDLEPLDLREPARESFRALGPSAEARRVRMEIELPERTVPVRGDRASLRLALDNLLDNAVKYTPPGGHVRMRLAARGGEAVVEVEDTGIGIEPRHGERVFERFYRVDKARSRDLGGTGLGLSIVRNAMVIHGGRVDYESSPGTGSVFRLTLPLEPV
jgi:two-component system phosphate regulon sensor histidine kinase PhoR